LSITYTTRLTDAQKWALDVKMNAYASVTLDDTTYSINATVWITKIEATYEGNVNWALPWRYEITVIKVT